MEHEIRLECEQRISELEHWKNDNGEWGAETKVAKMWDWQMQAQGKQARQFIVNNIALIFSGISSMAALSTFLFIILRGTP